MKFLQPLQILGFLVFIMSVLYLASGGSVVKRDTAHESQELTGDMIRDALNRRRFQNHRTTVGRKDGAEDHDSHLAKDNDVGMRFRRGLASEKTDTLEIKDMSNKIILFARSVTVRTIFLIRIFVSDNHLERAEEFSWKAAKLASSFKIRGYTGPSAGTVKKGDFKRMRPYTAKELEKIGILRDSVAETIALEAELIRELGSAIPEADGCEDLLTEYLRSISTRNGRLSEGTDPEIDADSALMFGCTNQVMLGLLYRLIGRMDGEFAKGEDVPTAAAFYLSAFSSMDHITHAVGSMNAMTLQVASFGPDCSDSGSYED